MNQIMALAQASNDTVHMVGRHGIGKSQCVEGFCADNNIHLEILMLSQNEVADLIGMPYEKDGVTYWSKPVWMQRMEDANAQDKHCLLFLDELARAPLEVRQSALQLVLDRRIHEHFLPELNGIKTLVVAADNPASEYQTDELDAALLDRFASYEVETDVAGWLKWARANNLESVVTDFIAEFPEKLHWMAEDSEDDKGSTPRAWAKLSDNIKNFKLIPDSLILQAIESKIGKTVGNSFYFYFNDYVKVLKVADIVKFIGKSPIKTISEQEKMAEKLSEVTKAMEAISADQLAQKIKKEIESDKLSHDVLTCYLGSLNLEVAGSIFKTWKEDPETEEFYFTWAKTIEDRWLIRRITTKVKD